MLHEYAMYSRHFCKQSSNAFHTVVQSVCAEAASFDLPAAGLAGAMEEARAALEAALVRRERDSAGGPQVVSSSTRHRKAEGCVLQTCSRPQQVFVAAVQGTIAEQLMRSRQTCISGAQQVRVNARHELSLQEGVDMQAGGLGEPNYGQMVGDLRGLETLLRHLEDAIAALARDNSAGAQWKASGGKKLRVLTSVRGAACCC